jgi:hypothetical protein
MLSYVRTTENGVLSNIKIVGIWGQKVLFPNQKSAFRNNRFAV